MPTVSAVSVSACLRRRDLRPSGRYRAEQAALRGGTGWYVQQMGESATVRVLDDVNPQRGEETAEQILAALRDGGFTCDRHSLSIHITSRRMEAP
jgi:hypothetical protein